MRCIALSRLFFTSSLLLVVGCSDGSDTTTDPVDWTSVGGGGNTPTSGTGGEGGDGGGDAGGGGTGGGGGTPDCWPATGSRQLDTASWVDGPDMATVAIDDRDSCERTYTLTTTAPLRDDRPANPRAVVEQTDWPVLRTHHDMLDALYALALDETRELSVSSIQDFAFNDGQPVACPAGGCFETGRLWKYVWTRDSAYAMHLGLGLLDPPRAQSTLAFKLSERRGGGDLQIVQDTGTGGSYPISTDRVTWALGAWELLKVLDGPARSAFLDTAYLAMTNTAEHDRRVVFDPNDGLYRGEQSFLDWREQSYPAWVATDTVHIGMSKALSTNVAHHALLDITASLADEKGLTSERDRYQSWAEDLATAIDTHLWSDSDGLYATYLTTELDPSAVGRFDLLGNALIATSTITDVARAQRIVRSYPHLPKGPSVMWPQQKDTPIYHNRSIWPFVTSLWLRAAKRANNAPAISHGVRSLVRGAALNLSNMENFEAVTGAAWLDDGPFSGPTVNSQRQLWSVAGFVSMVHDVLFGMETSPDGVRFNPFIPSELRTTLLSGADRIALSNLPYKGKRLSVELVLGDASQEALAATSVRVNGSDVGTGFIAAADLPDEAHIEVVLSPVASSETITEIDAADIADYRNLFGPQTPAVTAIDEANGLLTVSIDIQGETATDIELDVFRDGERIATGLAGNTTSFTDTTSAGQITSSYCYTIEARFITSGTRSQHAAPRCYWGPANNRIQSVGAQAFSAVGGTLVFNHGRWHQEAWGDPGHSITLSFNPTFTGKHYIQALAGNGAGSFTSGITCAVKRIEVRDGSTVVASGYLSMPQLNSWDTWRESSLFEADLDASKTYTVVIFEDDVAINMSERSHFESYGATGGQSGRFNRVNIAEVKFLASTL